MTYLNSQAAQFHLRFITPDLFWEGNIFYFDSLDR